MGGRQEIHKGAGVLEVEGYVEMTATHTHIHTNIHSCLRALILLAGPRSTLLGSLFALQTRHHNNE